MVYFYFLYSLKVGATIPCQENVAMEHGPHSWKTLMSRPILMPLTIGLTLLAIQQLSGIDSIIFFTVEIFRSSGMSFASAQMCLKENL